MDTKLQIVAGPPTNMVTREKAEEDLKSHPNFPKNASVVLDEVEGRWVAAIHVAEDLTKESAPPFGGDGGGESGPPAPPSDSGESDAPSDSSGEEEKPPSEEGDEKPKEEGEPKGEKGVEAQLHAVTEMLHTLMSALGLAPSPADSMVPGADAGPGGPPGAGGPPAPGGKGPQGVGPDGKQRVVHERGLKPGEAPPGSTPVGAPAFASVEAAEEDPFEDHPWKQVIGKVRTFTATEVIGEDESLSDVEAEVKQMAEGTGYEIKQLREGREDGKRVARVLLSR